MITTTGTSVANSGYPQMQFHSYLPYNLNTRNTLPLPALRAFYLRRLVMARHLAENPELPPLPSPHYKGDDAQARADWEALLGVDLREMLRQRGIPLINFLQRHLERNADGVYCREAFQSLQKQFWPFDKKVSQHRVRSHDARVRKSWQWMRCTRITKRRSTGGPRTKLPKGWGLTRTSHMVSLCFSQASILTEAYRNLPSDVVSLSPEKKNAIIIRWRSIARRIARKGGTDYNSEVGPAGSSSAQAITVAMPSVTGQASVLPTTQKTEKQQSESRSWQDSERRTEHVYEMTTDYVGVRCQKEASRLLKIIAFINDGVPNRHRFDQAEAKSILRKQDRTYTISGDRLAANPKAIARSLWERTQRCHSIAATKGFSGNNAFVNYLEPTPGTTLSQPFMKLTGYSTSKPWHNMYYRPRLDKQLSQPPSPAAAAESVTAHLQARYEMQRIEAEAIVRYNGLRYKTIFHDILARLYPEMLNTNELLPNDGLLGAHLPALSDEVRSQLCATLCFRSHVMTADHCTAGRNSMKSGRNRAKCQKRAKAIASQKLWQISSSG